MGNAGGDGVPLLYTSIVLLVLTWLTCMLRGGVRIWRKALGLDDLLMFIGLVRLQCPFLFLKAAKAYSTDSLQLLFTVTASLCIVCVFYGSGQFTATINPVDNAKGIKVCVLGVLLPSRKQ